MTSGTGNRNNIEIFLYSWRALLWRHSHCDVIHYWAGHGLPKNRNPRNPLNMRNPHT